MESVKRPYIRKSVQERLALLVPRIEKLEAGLTTKKALINKLRAKVSRLQEQLNTKPVEASVPPEIQP